MRTNVLLLVEGNKTVDETLNYLINEMDGDSGTYWKVTEENLDESWESQDFIDTSNLNAKALVEKIMKERDCIYVFSIHN